jgi:hypothetical protein
MVMKGDECRLRTCEEAKAEAEPHISGRGLEDGGAHGANDAAEDVGSQRELVL